MPLNSWVDPVTVVADVLAEPGFPTPEDRITADRAVRWITLDAKRSDGRPDAVIAASDAVAFPGQRTLTSDLMARRVVAALALGPATAGRKGTVGAGVS